MGSAYRRTSDQACYAETGSRMEKEDYIRWAWKSARVRKKGSACMGDCREGTGNFGRTGLRRTDTACMLESRSVHRSVLIVLSVPDRWIAGKKKVDAYVDTLCKELEFIAERSKNKKLNTIYIGGGTPTTLTAEQLERLMGWIDEKFFERTSVGIYCRSRKTRQHYRRKIESHKEPWHYKNFH